MTAADINHVLNVQFERYDYRLNNAYLFSYGWESDFVCLSSGGYWVECEVKISRADFWRDFEKPKHQFFEALAAGRHMVTDRNQWGNPEGDILARWEEPVINTDYGPGKWKNRNTGAMEDHWLSQYNSAKKEWGYVVNDWGRTWVWKEQKEIQAPSSRIHVLDISKYNMPHQFYFTVPRGLVTLAEVPAYAGLIYVDDGDCEIVRRAPYLHKRKMDLTKSLLKKYYNLWRFTAEVDKYSSCLHLKMYNL